MAVIAGDYLFEVKENRRKLMEVILVGGSRWSLTEGNQLDGKRHNTMTETITMAQSLLYRATKARSGERPLRTSIVCER